MNYLQATHFDLSLSLSLSLYAPYRLTHFDTSLSPISFDPYSCTKVLDYRRPGAIAGYIKGRERHHDRIDRARQVEQHNIRKNLRHDKKVEKKDNKEESHNRKAKRNKGVKRRTSGP